MEYIILGIVLALIVFFLLVNICDMNRFTVSHYEIASEKIKKEIKVAFLSDLHDKKYGKDNQKLMTAIAKEAPELLLVGGDMIVAASAEKRKKNSGNNKTGRKKRAKNINKNAQAFMNACAEQYPMYHALGNHEYRADIYRDTYGTMYDEYTRPLQDKGVIFLRNSKVFLMNQNIELAGLEIDRHFYKKFRVVPMEEEYITQTLGERNKEHFTILLAHNPDYFDKYADYGADLVLSGHLHGGLVRMPFWGGIASPAVRFFPKYNGGLYQKKNSTMIVSRGLGTHTLPVRIFNPAELVIITLKPSEK